MTRLVLCADDYAQSAGIADGILHLLAAGRLSAVSAFTLSPHWPGAGRALIPYRGVADLGVHLNLTHPFTREAKTLSYWLLRSRLPGLPRAKLQAEFLRQIDAFADCLGFLPDFIDGHQHVHAFPGLREALTAAIAARWRGQALPYVRAPDSLAHGGDLGLKAGVLRAVCRGMASHLRRCGLASPPWFAGVYSLRAGADFPGLMAAWLAACPDRGLVMCHPGRADDGDEDPIGAARPLEYAYLASEDFARLCRARGVELARFA